MHENVNQITDDVNLTLKQILEYQIFSIGKYSLSVYQIVVALIIFIIGALLARMIKVLIYRTDRLDLGKICIFSDTKIYGIYRYIFHRNEIVGYQYLSFASRVWSYIGRDRSWASKFGFRLYFWGDYTRG